MTLKLKNHAKTCLIVSGTIILVALLMTVFGYGMNLGIDFSGGIIMLVCYHNAFSGNCQYFLNDSYPNIWLQFCHFL